MAILYFGFSKELGRVAVELGVYIQVGELLDWQLRKF